MSELVQSCTRPASEFCPVDDPGFQCNVTQTFSLNYNLSNTDIVGCADFAQAVNISCYTTVKQFVRLLPGNNEPAPTPSTASITSVAVIATLYFLLPLALFFTVVGLRRKQQKRLSHDRSTFAEHDTEPERSNNGGAHSQQQTESEPKEEVMESFLSFHDLRYSVKLNKAGIRKAIEENGGTKPQTPGWDLKHILKGITGTFEPGTLSAIMGPSGCGKSTMLDSLANRKHGGYTNGKVLVNGHERGPFFKRISAYVMQSDALFPHLTVREMLRYTAELRLPGVSLFDKEQAVNCVIRDLDLTRVADSFIGGGRIRGISGGQARRVTVGVELITRPSILFLDECTTGLDAYSSLMLVKTLRRLADSKRTVICTIHQPRPDIFKLFDTLLLMKAGETAYFGPLTELSRYFGEIGLTIPGDVNPADFVVDLTYSKEKTDVEKSGQAVDRLVGSYESSNLAARNQEKAKAIESLQLAGLPPSIDEMFAQRGTSANQSSAIRKAISKFRSTDSNFTGTSQGNHVSRYNQGIRVQTYVLLRRSYKNLFRNTGYFATVFLQSIQFLFYGLLFLGLRTESLESNEQGLIKGSGTVGLNVLTAEILYKRNFLFQVSNTMALVESVVISAAFLEKRIFMREHAAGTYSVVSYHAQWIIRLSVDAVWKALLASILCYFFPPLNITASNFFFFFLVLAVTSTLGSSLAFLMVAAVPDAEGASNIHNTIVGFFGTYSGFYLPPNLIPIFTLWAYYIVPSKYVFEALLWNEFGDCASFYDIDSVLQLDQRLNKWTNVLVLMAYPVIFHGFALAASFLRTRPSSYWTKNFPTLFAVRNLSQEPVLLAQKGTAAHQIPEDGIKAKGVEEEEQQQGGNEEDQEKHVQTSNSTNLAQV